VHTNSLQLRLWPVGQEHTGVVFSTTHVLTDWLTDWLHGFLTHTNSSVVSIFLFQFLFINFLLMSCYKLSWLLVELLIAYLQDHHLKLCLSHIIILLCICCRDCTTVPAKASNTTTEGTSTSVRLIDTGGGFLVEETASGNQSSFPKKVIYDPGSVIWLTTFHLWMLVVYFCFVHYM